jgi:hypothetical protein
LKPLGAAAGFRSRAKKRGLKAEASTLLEEILQMPNSPILTNDANFMDEASILAMLAAEGARGFDQNLKPVSIPALKVAGTSECDPDSDWYVEGAEPGDIVVENVVVAKASAGLTVVPFYDRELFTEQKTLSDSKGDTKKETVETWAKEPTDVEFVQGKGGGRLRPNGHRIVPRRLLHCVHAGIHVCLTAFNDIRDITALRKTISRKRIRFGDSRSTELPLYACTIKIGSEERQDGRGLYWAPTFTLVDIYPGANGPDRATLLLARDLCAEQEAIKYPDPNVKVVSLTERRAATATLVENGPPTPPAPPPSGPNAYGARRDPLDNDIPF